ncbi:hypothetical protein ACSBR2_020251 [Camellia fascicularis]
MNSFSPWKRKRPEREDIDTKSAALKASPSVVSLTSLTGGKMMFACSGTIIECEDVNGTFINTVLTFATLLRSPIDANAIPDDIKTCPRDMVVAIGHSCGRTHALMAASGKFRKSRRPWLGMEMTNLYVASVGKLEKIISKFNISKGVLVEEVWGSAVTVFLKAQGAEGLLGLKCKARRTSLQQGAAFQ